MSTPEKYFNELNLWNLDTLKQHAEHNLVNVHESTKFPGLVLLKYKDECQYDAKWSTFSKMSRGLVVSIPERKILAHGYDKFFTLGQVPEVSYENLVSKGSFEVSEKLDGSCIILFQDPTTGEYRGTTMGSLTSEQGEYATSILPAQVKSKEFTEDYTLTFELISKKFQIVIDYAKKNYPENLYLVGVRHRKSNKVFSYAEVKAFAQSLSLPTIKTYEFVSLDQLIEHTKQLPVLEEGYVLRFDDGLLVKVKGLAYLAAHRFISKLSDKYLLEAIGQGTEKDLVTACPEEYVSDVETKILHYKMSGKGIIDNCYELFHYAPKDTRKDYALWVKNKVAPDLHGFMFTLFDNKPLPMPRVFELVGRRENVSAETKI